MAKQKKHNTAQFISPVYTNVNRLLLQGTSKPQERAKHDEKQNDEPPQFYDKPIHRAKKHDLF